MKNRDGRKTVRSCMNMKEYVIEKTVGAPDWTKVSELQVDNVCWLPDAGVRMEQQICYDDKKIYVHQVAHEKNIRAELTDKLGSICTDSCMEFFFRAASTYDCGWTVRAADNADTSHIVSCLRCIAVRAWRNFQRLVPLSTITDRNIAVRFRRKRIAHGGKMRRIKPAVRAETLFGNCLPLQFLYG